MTCIVGLETEWGVYMGADSSATGDWDIYQTRLNKVFKVGPLLIGYADSFRAGQLLRHHLEVPKRGKNQKELEYLVVSLVPAIRQTLKDGGYTQLDASREVGGTFLVGYGGSIYTIYSDFHVNSSRDGYMSIGCGSQYALGSLYATNNHQNLLGQTRVRLALEAATHFSNGVSEPIIVIGEND